MNSMTQAVVTLTRRRIAQFHILVRAFQGEKEDQYKIVRYVVSRLPISDAAKKNLITRTLTRIVDRERQTLAHRTQRAQRQWDIRGHEHLRRLLVSDQNIQCPTTESPAVSFILVLFNKAHLSLLAIESILRYADVSYELVIVDNASSDETPTMLRHFAGAKVIQNSTNIGFGPACMQAAGIATGKYLCFLNNDALLTEGAISAALKNFESKRVGAVGGKILLANESLQEAGSIIWSDGSALGYGRGDNPQLPQYNFRRPVDYCSGVFLITPKQLFDKVGGFSTAFSPAYYEDADYCMTLWHNGFRVLYEPLAVVVHYESASSGGNDFAVPLMASHQNIFRNKWGAALMQHYPPDASNVCAARLSIYEKRPWVLYVDDRIPERRLGAGFPRSNDILKELVNMGCQVTCSTSTFPLIENSYDDIPKEAELFDGFNYRQQLLEQYLERVDIVWVSRPHNLKILLGESKFTSSLQKFTLVYDAEAIFSQRDLARDLLLGDGMNSEQLISGLDSEEELNLARSADLVCVTSPSDKEFMLRGGVASVSVIADRISVAPTTSMFAERKTFLFVGSIHGSENPNIDSIRYFCRTMWSQVQEKTNAVLEIAGYGTELLNAELADRTVRILGPQSDLRPVYERARVFIVPTRYAAGIP
jgi:GT2 family glycosyltransferase